ncbi:MAG: hypothetical protein WC488_00585 [Candidatus Micrarchaeia archaeon]
MKLGTSVNSETRRKALHMTAGALFLSFLLVFGRNRMVALLVLVLIGGLCIINMLLMGWRVPFTGWFIRNFERQGVRFPGYATAWYVSGLLMAATVLHDQGEIAAVICALAFGDGASAILGERGERKLFYNKEKTAEGLAAFFAATLTSCLFVGWIGILFAALAALFESLPLEVDDNFTIPLFGALFFYLV